MLGALVLVSGLAAAGEPDPQHAICRKVRVMWGPDNPTPSPSYMVYQALYTAHSFAPLNTSDLIGPSLLPSYDEEEVCVNFLNVCGPIWDLIDRL